MKNLANETVTGAVLQDDYVLVTAGGSVRRIKVEDFVASINAGNQQLLLEVAWGVPIKQNASSPAWGVVGNTTMRDEYLSEIGRAFLTNDGKIAKLSKHDSSHFADGTVVDETRGHVMFYSPRLYYLVKEDAQTGIPTLWMSMVPIGGHYIEEQCFGAYKGSLSGGALVSRSGVAPQGAKTITQFWNYASPDHHAEPDGIRQRKLPGEHRQRCRWKRIEGPLGRRRVPAYRRNQVYGRCLRIHPYFRGER